MMEKIKLTEQLEDGRYIPRIDLKTNGYERCIQKLGEIEDREEDIKKMIQNRIEELKNSRAGYMVCGISCNHAVVAELERLLKETGGKKDEMSKVRKKNGEL